MLSIVVLTYNRREIVKRCINAVIDNTETQDYELIVIDNDSKDGTFEMLTRMTTPKMTLILKDGNYGQLSRNDGHAIAKGEIIVQVDDDCFVNKGWDKAVIKAMKDPAVGMVGVQGGIYTNFPECELWKTNNGFVDVLTGFFYAFRNDGFFYDPGYEGIFKIDDELSLQVKAKGYKIKLIDASICTHASARKETPWDEIGKNTAYMVQKWIGQLDKLRLGGN